MTPTKEEFEKLAVEFAKHYFGRDFAHPESLTEEVQASLQAVWSEVFPPVEGIPVRIAVGVASWEDGVVNVGSAQLIYGDEDPCVVSRRICTAHDTHRATVSVVIPPIPAVPTVTGEARGEA